MQFAQSATYTGKDRWDWSVWLDGAPAELDEVKSVTYFLHPTFVNPERIVTDRANGFRLNSSGWGEFTIRADIHLRNGQMLQRTHNLVLAYPRRPSLRDAVSSIGEKPPTKEVPGNQGTRRSDPKDRPIVFVSNSAIDQPIAAAIGEALEARGIRCVSDSALNPDVPVQASLSRVIRSSDAVVAVVSDHASDWTSWEIHAARSLDVPVFPIVVGETTELPARLRNLEALRIRGRAGIEPLVDWLVERIRSIDSGH